MQRRHFCALAGAASLLPMAHARAASPGYPQRVVRIICPYAAGGGPDVQLRQMAPALARRVVGLKRSARLKARSKGMLHASEILLARALFRAGPHVMELRRRTRMGYENPFWQVNSRYRH